jgi:hypothetical protein
MKTHEATKIKFISCESDALSALAFSFGYTCSSQLPHLLSVSWSEFWQKLFRRQGKTRGQGKGMENSLTICFTDEMTAAAIKRFENRVLVCG